MELAGKMALVTGASGFIGGHTARRLAIAEHMRVRALLRNPTGSTVVDLRHALIEPVCGDLLEPPSLEAACVGCDLIVHAATDTALTNRRLIRATSVDGTRNLLRAAGVAGAQRFIFISTFDVYFGSLKQFRDEDTPVHPFGDLYADGKILAEEVLLGSGTALPAIVVLRPPAVFGPGSREWTV
ncbi:MAG: NAD-dependent epimerase/dehydratase family protein, partial [Anaerolineae bacterium]|nr:NAD-dependent epimerase/dehydratase family protein [Anaerolineae bacterium]